MKEEVTMQEMVSKDIRDKVDREVVQQGNELTCEEIQPQNSEYKGEGEARCVFEKEGNIIKIAKNHEGITQTQGAKAVHENVEGYDDVLAKPKDVDERVGIIQEKVTPYPETVEDDKVMEIAMAERGISRKEPKNMRLNNKLVELRNTQGVHCEDDKNPYNWGVKGDNLVLIDLGCCTNG